MEITKDEKFINDVMRYLGYNDNHADAVIMDQISQISDDLSANINEKNIYDICNCQVSDNTVKLDDLEIKSKNLSCCLKKCGYAVLLAATLGTEADIILRRYAVRDTEKALIAHAVCAVTIERYCVTIVSEVSHDPKLSKLFPTLQYSPGYGDFDIIYQKDIINMLGTEKKIGLSLTSGFMMIPSKSITAIIGFSGEKNESLNKCSQCANTQCGFRRESL